MADKLPDPRWRILAITKHDTHPRWLTYHSGWKCFHDECHSYAVELLSVVTHPRNDPEAVEIVRLSRPCDHPEQDCNERGGD